jgi:molybdopterin-binding protein
MTLSARNRLEGKITELQLGGVMAHVVVRVGDNLIESVITRRSAEDEPQGGRHGFGGD